MASSMEVKPMNTDSETATEVEIVAPEPHVQKRRLLIGAVAGTAVLVAGATAVATKSSTQWRGTNAVSRYEEADSRTGCSNWETIQLKFIEGTSHSQCDQECHNYNANAGYDVCLAFNFQPRASCNGEKAPNPHGCYLFKDGCRKENNECWDFYTIKSGGGSTTATTTTTTTTTTTSTTQCTIDDNKCKMGGGDAADDQELCTRVCDHVAKVLLGGATGTCVPGDCAKMLDVDGNAV